jgi:hypothetical protein
VGAAQYDNGFAPAVALAGATVIEVHQGSSPILFYRLGTDGTISWGTDVDYQTGAAPSIAIAGPDLVEVHEGDTGTLFSLAGQF